MVAKSSVWVLKALQFPAFQWMGRRRLSTPYLGSLQQVSDWTNDCCCLGGHVIETFTD